MPLWIFLSQMIFIFQALFGTDFPQTLQNYIQAFSDVPCAPAAINPIVAIYLLRPYREAVIRLVRQAITH